MRLSMQALQLRSLYQTVWQQVRDATPKPFGRNNICIDCAKKEGSSSNFPVNCLNGIKLYNSKMGGVDLMDRLKSS